jgi:hypothetical protein
MKITWISWMTNFFVASPTGNTMAPRVIIGDVDQSSIEGRRSVWVKFPSREGRVDEGEILRDLVPADNCPRPQ